MNHVLNTEGKKLNPLPNFTTFLLTKVIKYNYIFEKTENSVRFNYQGCCINTLKNPASCFRIYWDETDKQQLCHILSLNSVSGSTQIFSRWCSFWAPEISVLASPSLQMNSCILLNLQVQFMGKWKTLLPSTLSS